MARLPLIHPLEAVQLRHQVLKFAIQDAVLVIVRHVALPRVCKNDSQTRQVQSGFTKYINIL